MANFNVVAQYPPGTMGAGCFLCSCTVPRDKGYGETEAVVDTGVVVEYEGGLALCESCGREIGRLVGLVEPAAVEQAAADAVDAGRTAAEALDRAERAEDLALALLRYAEVEPFAAADEDEGPSLAEQFDAAVQAAVQAAVAEISAAVRSEIHAAPKAKAHKADDKTAKTEAKTEAKTGKGS